MENVHAGKIGMVGLRRSSGRTTLNLVRVASLSQGVHSRVPLAGLLNWLLALPGQARQRRASRLPNQLSIESICHAILVSLFAFLLLWPFDIAM